MDENMFEGIGGKITALLDEKGEQLLLAAVGVLVLVGAAAFAAHILNTNCGSDVACFRKALKECSNSRLEFSEDIPLEGTYSYRYETAGAVRVTRWNEECSIKFQLNITETNKTVTERDGLCVLRQYRDLEMGFEWAGRAEKTLPGECLKLERKLNGLGG